jgi:hypothetical protein
MLHHSLGREIEIRHWRPSPELAIDKKTGSKPFVVSANNMKLIL